MSTFNGSPLTPDLIAQLVAPQDASTGDHVCGVDGCERRDDLPRSAGLVAVVVFFVRLLLIFFVGFDDTELDSQFSV